MIRFLTAVFVALALPVSAEVKIQEVTSDGGITAWLVEEHSIPFTALEIRFRGGASLDPAGKRGAINLMTATLEEGAGDLDAQGFAQARDALAAQYSFDVYDDALSISAQFLTENQDAAIDLLREALVNTRFDQSAIDRVRAQVEGVIRSDTTDPSDIARAALNGAAFGDHPYGSDLNGTLDSIATLTRDDMFEARDRVIAKDRIFVSAVGDITPEKLGLMLDTLFDGLPETGAPMPDETDFALGGGVTVIDFETPQSIALFGHEGIERDDERFFEAFILNTVLGGGNFDARLMTEVREKRGLTYGVNTFLVPKDHGEAILGSVRSSNDRIAQAIEVIRDEWARIATQGITEDELNDAKRYLTGAYPLRFDGNGPIANIMVGMQMQGLPIDYIATRNERLNALTLEQVNTVAAEIFDPEALHFVVVGQPENLTNSN